MEKDMNFNYSECVKRYDKWGETTYQNICTGEETTLPWGVSGYFVLVLIIVIIVLVISLIVGFIKLMFE